ncbi:MAG: hypothetical protein MJ117_06260 [Lachnospiraceae bacterium]|nr:hypothetical protein [Lachnospiraceae bacterium]
MKCICKRCDCFKGAVERGRATAEMAVEKGRATAGMAVERGKATAENAVENGKARVGQLVTDYKEGTITAKELLLSGLVLLLTGIVIGMILAPKKVTFVNCNTENIADEEEEEEE